MRKLERKDAKFDYKLISKLELYTNFLFLFFFYHYFTRCQQILIFTNTRKETSKWATRVQVDFAIEKNHIISIRYYQHSDTKNNKNNKY